MTMPDEVKRAYGYLAPDDQKILNVLILEMATKTMEISRLAKELLKQVEAKK